MIREIQRQLIDTYRDMDDGFLIVNNDKIVYLNDGAAKCLKCSNEQKTLFDVFNITLARVIGEAILENKCKYLRKVIISKESYNIGIISLAEYGFVFLHKESDLEKYSEFVEFNMRTVSAIALYQKQVFDDAQMMLDTKLSRARLSNLNKRAIKANTTISEMSKCVWSKSDKQISCNVAMLIKNAVKNASNILENLEIYISDIPEKHIAYCDMRAVESAIYSVISAYAYGQKKSEIEIKLQCVNEQVLIVITSKNLKWEKQRMDYIYKKRKEHLDTDVHLYGYDILRAANLMEWQEGELLVSSADDDTKVVLVLPNRKTESSEMLMKSSEESFMNACEAEIVLSDLL